MTFPEWDCKKYIYIMRMEGSAAEKYCLQSKINANGILQIALCVS